MTVNSLWTTERETCCRLVVPGLQWALALGIKNSIENWRRERERERERKRESERKVDEGREGVDVVIGKVCPWAASWMFTSGYVYIYDFLFAVCSSNDVTVIVHSFV